MATTSRPTSVRALGARRLTQATVAMVVGGAGATGALIIHESAGANASTTTGTSSSTGSSDSTGTSSQLNSTQGPAQATSGGS